MIKKLFSVALAVGTLSLIGCGDKDSGDDGADGSSGGDLCSDYTAAINECYAEAGVDVAALGITDTYCDAYAGNTTYDSYFSCYIDAISAADCSTQEGITALSTAAASCTPG
jgi:hypothetical protein